MPRIFSDATRRECFLLILILVWQLIQWLTIQTEKRLSYPVAKLKSVFTPKSQNDKDMTAAYGCVCIGIKNARRMSEPLTVTHRQCQTLILVGTAKVRQEI